MKHIISLLISALFVFPAFSQNIQGNVMEKKDGKNLPLPGVNVYWPESLKGTTTNADGSFVLEAPETFPAKLVFSYVGYRADTITITGSQSPVNVYLQQSIDLKAVEIFERQQGTSISMLSPINAETIGSNELKKAACCNLAESFETNASVDVNYTDAVSGARQIQMLGLDGIYTQTMSENMPGVRGLASSYGLAFIPGTWIESIQVSKGAGSVVNGYESITGQINVEYLKPENTEKLYINGYANHQGRYEGNIHYAEKLTEKWSTLTFAHASAVTRKVDMNGDGFLNTPLQNQFNVFNRWKYSGKGRMQAQFGIKALIDDRTGGQSTFDPRTDYGTQNNYGITINSRQLEAFSKTSVNSETNPYRSLGLISSLKHYKQDALFGIRNYSGEQNTAYLNLIYQDYIYTTDHKIKAGASLLSDNYSEMFLDSSFSRNEFVPGIFGEYHHEIENKYSVLLGLRGDYHNMFGFIPTPRVHLKANLLPKTVARASAGRGFRVANVFAENSAIFASSRSIHVSRELAPEVAWSVGGGITHNICFGERGFVFNVDFYRTDFINQVVVDYDRSMNEIHFYNLDGRSYSNSFQAEMIVEASKNLEFKTAYKWYDVKSTYDGELLHRPLISNHRMLFNTTYHTKFDKWKFDFTAKWFGPSRIPGDHLGPIHLPERSPDYWILHAQVTRSFKTFDIYLGGENLNNFMQPNPILAPDDPFGPNFDASLLWGPLMGRVI
ncbi:MAG: TonB-dependent receptor, partial [Bacteroidetes bacterium]|nr:TonB-dependent receptor [Bacteroidota bacterium]